MADNTMYNKLSSDKLQKQAKDLQEKADRLEKSGTKNYSIVTATAGAIDALFSDPNFAENDKQTEDGIKQTIAALTAMIDLCQKEGKDKRNYKYYAALQKDLAHAQLIDEYLDKIIGKADDVEAVDATVTDDVANVGFGHDLFMISETGIAMKAQQIDTSTLQYNGELLPLTPHDAYLISGVTYTTTIDKKTVEISVDVDGILTIKPLEAIGKLTGEVVGVFACTSDGAEPKTVTVGARKKVEVTCAVVAPT
jgi:hypothetical protein